MTSATTITRRRILGATFAVALLLLGVTAAALRLTARAPQPPAVALPLRQAATITLPGNGSRFDYASLDPDAGLLFIAHLGASQVIELDVHADRVVRVINGLSEVHGVLVVPELRRVYATATGQNQMVTLNEDTGAVLARTPTGDYPDGLAYDPAHQTIWTTNETGGTETVIDATTGAARGSVQLGGEAGNNAYDRATGSILVDVQSRNQLDAIDPATLTITRRLDLPGCDHDHGLTIDGADRLAFVACDGNARLLTVDLTTWRIIGTNPVGQDPDVLAYDSGAARLYVAAESGWVTVLDRHGKTLTVTGSAHLADGAHVVAVDPRTHRSYFPIPAGPEGQPALMVYQGVVNH
jgi:DNA-binding beta-propeller fold protein YncE